MTPTSNLLLNILTGAIDIETGHQWTSDPVPVDLLGKAATLVVTATPASQPAGGQPPLLEELLTDALDLAEGQSFTTPAFMVDVPTPTGSKPFAVTVAYTVTPTGQGQPAAQEPVKTPPPGSPGHVTKIGD